MSTRQEDYQSFAMVLFGATGDLAKRKLFPALYGLHRGGLLNPNFAVVGTGRSAMEPDAFRAYLRESIETFGRLEIDDEQDFNEFLDHFDYIAFDVTDPGAYSKLVEMVKKREEQYSLPQNRLFYLSLAPDLFGPVAINLKKAGLTSTSGWKRLVIEKPFGHDYASAKELNEQIQQSFREEEIFRIDHYLGKEMVQNIEVIRFANSMFEPMWNNKYIKSIQITAAETVGVEERASYYEHAGALRDMVQNHILQMVMMVCMEPPSTLKTEAIRDEKVKVLRALRRYSEEEVEQYVVRGQYIAGTMNGKSMPGYREEHNVQPDSLTETYVAAKLHVDNFRWAGVPIYIRTGKRLPKKTTKIVIEFKEMPKYLYFNKEGNLNPNLLVIRINPEEGISLILNAKKPGAEDDVAPISLDFCNNCANESPEAYERLFFDAIEGDSTFFTRWDEVSLAWKFVDPISHSWEKAPRHTMAFYEAGSWGPSRVENLLAQDGSHWWSVSQDISQRRQVTVVSDEPERVLSRR